MIKLINYNYSLWSNQWEKNNNKLIKKNYINNKFYAFLG